ncbi:rhodanese-like domain-containing protein [Variovorax sp. LjRoot84]|uniref:rhodanese-like domain-containing protein n=1 Tax=Variovorax sp. LjRoot84 TaxID=3342340 RepID=UPI003ECCC857
MSNEALSPGELQALLLGSAELALLDVREARWFCDAHLNLARLAPLSTLELQIGALVPRRTTELVVCDEADAQEGPAARAAALLERLGYSRVRRLAGGLNAWRAEGLPVIDGYATLVKAFGDLARLHYGTPTLSLAEFEERRRTGQPITLIDARPRDEYAFLSIEGARNYAGTELALRALHANEPGHVWVVNCFSRTRGIVGATTLRLLAGGDQVVFLEDGVMAWGLRGGPVVENAQPVDDIPAEPPELLRALADRLIARHGLSVIDAEGLARLQADRDRTLYLFDLRPSSSPANGVRHVPGGQLLMHFENLVGTRNARIVLIDEPHRLRAAVTAFWLAQLNQAEVHVLAGELPVLPPTPEQAEPANDGLAPDALARLIARGEAELVDVGPSLDYEKRHLPGARFLLPASLAPLEPVLAPGRTVVFSSPDGAAARLAARDARQRWPASAFAWLAGGTDAWAADGRPVEASYAPQQLLTPFDDDWGSVMRISGPRRDEVWTDYLEWERGLSRRVTEDPAVRFRFFV